MLPEIKMTCVIDLPNKKDDLATIIGRTTRGTKDSLINLSSPISRDGHPGKVCHDDSSKELSESDDENDIDGNISENSSEKVSRVQACMCLNNARRIRRVT